MWARKLMDYIGDISQVGGIKRYTFLSGKAKGVEAYDINNGKGLQYTVVADRGLDIYNLSYKCTPIAFISKTGIVSPFLYNERGDEWLRSFTGGFLTTCGLSQVGDPCVFEGKENGLHGYYSNLPAEDVCVFSDWINDSYVMKISGKIRQAKVQFENLVLRRTIETNLGDDELVLTDLVRNEGFEEVPFMILYHMNFGYPFLNPQSEIVIPSRGITGWDKHSEMNTHKYREITEPDSSAAELTYYHDLYCDKDGYTKFMITDNTDDPHIAVVIKYNKNVLHNLTQWKYLRKNDYVMALEPCNNLVKGVEYEYKHGNIKYLKPGEEVAINIYARFLDSRKEILSEKNSILELNN